MCGGGHGEGDEVTSPLKIDDKTHPLIDEKEGGAKKSLEFHDVLNASGGVVDMDGMEIVDPTVENQVGDEKQQLRDAAHVAKEPQRGHMNSAMQAMIVDHDGVLSGVGDKAGVKEGGDGGKAGDKGTQGTYKKKVRPGPRV